MNNTMTLQGKLANLEVKTSKANKPYAQASVITEDSAGRAYEFPFMMFGDAVKQLEAIPKDGKVNVSGYVRREDYTPEEGRTITSFSLVGRKAEPAPDNAGYKNSFSLSGFVSTRNPDGKLELKESEAGKKYLKYAISAKRDVVDINGGQESEAKYDVYFMTAFGEAAEKMAKFKKGDLVEVSGNITVDEHGAITQVARQSKLVRDAASYKAQTENGNEKPQTNSQTNDQ